MTKDKVAQLTLRELRVFERGQPINGEYIESARAEYEAVYVDLGPLAFWDEATIPDNVGRHVAIVCAERLANEYGKNAAFQQALQHRADGRNNHMSAMARLREFSAAGSERSADEISDF